jgi:alanine racemase
MHRLGFESQEMAQLIEVLGEAKELKVASIFSHLAASEDPGQDAYTLEQGKAFERLSGMLLEGPAKGAFRHLSNTAAIARHPELHYDMVRLGLGLYGIDSSEAMHGRLQQASRLKTTIAQIKNVSAGDTIGYGRKGQGREGMRIATISIGYADGYPRSLSNGKGHVLIHGQKAPIVGIVCMDMCMVDVTDIAEAREGDEAIIFSDLLSIGQVASQAGIIPYELMTGIGQRVKRVYLNES